MNYESVAARRIKDPSAQLTPDGYHTSPGDFAWEFEFTHFAHGAAPEDEELTLYFHLPGDDRWWPIHVRRGAPGGDRVWGWDGNFDQPTTTPSILHPGMWHGYLTAGRFECCERPPSPAVQPDPRHRVPVTSAHPMLNFAQPAVPPKPAAVRDPRRVGGWGQ